MDSISAFSTLYGPQANERRVRGDRRGAGGVRPAVQEDPRADADELARAGGTVLHPDLRRVPVHVADERLLAAVDHLHRPVRVEREHRAVHLHRQILATAEGAADAREVDPHLFLLEPEAGRDLVAVDVQPLRGDVDVDTTLAVGHGKARFGPEERLILDPELVDAADRDVALRVGVAVPDADRAQDVRPRILAEAVAGSRVPVVDRRLLGRALGVDDRLQRLVRDHDLLGGAARLLRVLGRDDGDGLAEVANAVDREHRLVGELEPIGLGARDVGMREHGMDAGHRQRLRDVDLDDAGVRVGAAHGVTPEHPGRDEVACVGELSGHLRDRVDALDALADAAELELLSRRAHRLAASLTASKIFA